MEYLTILDSVMRRPDYKVQVEMSNVPYIFIQKCKLNRNANHHIQAATGYHLTQNSSTENFKWPDTSK